MLGRGEDGLEDRVRREPNAFIVKRFSERKQELHVAYGAYQEELPKTLAEILASQEMTYRMLGIIVNSVQLHPNILGQTLTGTPEVNINSVSVHDSYMFLKVVYHESNHHNNRRKTEEEIREMDSCFKEVPSYAYMT